MEGLVLLILGAVDALFGAFVIGTGGLLCELLFTLLSLLFGVASWRWRADAEPAPSPRLRDLLPPPGSPPAPAPSPVRPRPPSPIAREARQWLFRLAWRTMLAAAVALLLLGGAVQFFWFEPFVRMALARQPSLQIEFRAATGNLFTGTLRLEGVHLRRDDPARGSFAFDVDTLELALDLTGVFASPRPIARLELVGVRGRYAKGQQPAAEGRAFTIGELRLRDVDVRLEVAAGARAVAVPLQLDTWRSAPYRSQHALFDLVLRSTGSGRIAGGPLLIESHPARDAGGDGRQTDIRIQALPLEVLGAWLGGPLRLFSGGTADVEVHDHWLLGGDDRIDADWRLTLHDAVAAVPDDLDTAWAPVARVLAAWLNAHREPIALSARLKVADGQIDWGGSLASEQLALVLVESLLRELAARCGVDVDTLRACSRVLAGQAGKLLRDFVARRRK